MHRRAGAIGVTFFCNVPSKSINIIDNSRGDLYDGPDEVIEHYHRSDFQIAINSIIEKTKAHSLITNLIKDITTLATENSNIKFSNCIRILNKLAYRIA